MPGKRPKCNKCGASMRYLFIREYHTRINLGYYCDFCKSVYLKNGITSKPGPVYVGLKKVIS